MTRGVYRIIRDLGAAAGVHVRPHGIRHTAITQAIDLAAKKGMSIDVGQAIIDRVLERLRDQLSRMVRRYLP